MLKLLRNVCIWMCTTSCLFGYVTQAVPMEYFDDHEFSYDMDTAQSEVKYDPRLLSQQLKDQHNHPQERAASCFTVTKKYTHGERVLREDPCEVCLCVDGEIFCWWKKCGGNLKRRKFKYEKNSKLSKQKKAKTIDRIHKDQLNLKPKKKLDSKLKQQQQHWKEHHQQHKQQHTAARSKILSFPENLPSVLYYDYKTEDQHGFHHENYEEPRESLTGNKGSNYGTGVKSSHDAHAHTSTNGNERTVGGISREDDNNSEDDDNASSAVGVAEPTSTEMKFAVKSHTAADTSKKFSLQPTSTARITTTVSVASPSDPLSNDNAKIDQLNAKNQFISNHPAGNMQMFNIDGTRHTTEAVHHHNHTATQVETTFMATEAKEIDHDGILRGTGHTSDDDANHSEYPSYNYLNSNKQKNKQQKGVGTSFRSSFNDFSSEYNASAGLDLALIMSDHSAHDAPIILEADSIANSSSSLLSKHELGGPLSTNTSINNGNIDSSVLNSTMATSTTVNQEQECIVMGASYKIGAILPQETGNCLQCICIEGATKDDTPRVTCSPHNCPPLVLPDLFDATGY